MGNPLRSEADAFRFLLLTIGYFALIVIGAMINVWLGVAVFVVLTVGAGYIVLASRRGRSRPAGQPSEHRVLVVANETLGGPELLSELEDHVAGRSVRVLVVAPVAVSPLEEPGTDDGDARAVAYARLDQSVASMQAAGLDAAGEVGDADPVRAVENALRTFNPDELILATPPAGRSVWLEENVVEKVQERFALPLTHVVVDLGADRH